MGNPHLGVSGSFGEALVSVPLAESPDPVADPPDATRLALESAMRMRGGEDAWAFMPDRLALAYRMPGFALRLETRDWLSFVLELEGAAALLVGTSQEQPGIGLFVQAGATLAVELGPVRLGIEYRYALDSAGDTFSTTVPFVGLHVGDVDLRLFLVSDTAGGLGGPVVGLSLGASF